MADSDTPALGGRYAWDAATMALVCQHCGSLVHASSYAGAVSMTVGVHDAFHDFLDALQADIGYRDELAAEQRERSDG